MFNDKNVMFIRICSAVIPGIATLVAWFLAITGNAKDYKDNDGKEMSDFIAAD